MARARIPLTAREYRVHRSPPLRSSGGLRATINPSRVRLFVKNSLYFSVSPLSLPPAADPLAPGPRKRDAHRRGRSAAADYRAGITTARPRPRAETRDTFDT